MTQGRKLHGIEMTVTFETACQSGRETVKHDEQFDAPNLNFLQQLTPVFVVCVWQLHFHLAVVCLLVANVCCF